jgi:creatinine amidohydrolase
MLLYGMTWDEVAKLDRQAVVVAPFGAVEQHSFHLPMGTDSILIEAIAKRLEQRIPERVCVLPVTWLGCSRHHMDFAGSLTAEVETFIEVGEQLVGSMSEHGFRNFILLNGHGGNVNKISLMAEKLSYRPGPKLKVVGITYWHLISREIQDIRETPLGGMGHACELETSLMLAAHPELVRLGRMEADGQFGDSVFERKDMFSPGIVTVARQFKELSRHGGIGDPTTASAEKGERIFAAIVTNLVRVVDDIQAGIL